MKSKGKSEKCMCACYVSDALQDGKVCQTRHAGGNGRKGKNVRKLQILRKWDMKEDEKMCDRRERKGMEGE